MFSCFFFYAAARAVNPMLPKTSPASPPDFLKNKGGWRELFSGQTVAPQLQSPEAQCPQTFTTF